MATKIIIINSQDNVGIALHDIKKGENLLCPDGKALIALSNIARSHKVALGDIRMGEDVLKYGEIIGEAKEFIKKGDWVHTHNLDIEEKKR